jgi:hypothetical protein
MPKTRLNQQSLYSNNSASCARRQTRGSTISSVTSVGSMLTSRISKKDIRGLKLNTIAEIYKANLTVASFADHERRIEALERKLP